MLIQFIGGDRPIRHLAPRQDPSAYSAYIKQGHRHLRYRS